MGLFGLGKKKQEPVIDKAYAEKMRKIHEKLEDKSYEVYGSRYDALGEKEKNEIAMKAAAEK